MFANSVVPGF